MAIHDAGPVVSSRRGAFWVGTEPVQSAYGLVSRGPLFVEWEAPAEVTQPHPIVLVHGGGGQATDWTLTPDGRRSWAQHLVGLGFAVYVVDRPGHGRSPWHPDVLGAMGPPCTLEFAEWLFDPPPADDVPQAARHTRWPADRDAALRAFLAGTGPMLTDAVAAHALERERGAELLDLIGPAIVVAHSAGGPMGFVMADARPEQVVALLAIECMGPPFLDNPEMGVRLHYGVAASPMTFDPPVADASELRTEVHEAPEGGPPMVLQAEPARRLSALAQVPIAVVTAEASRFLDFDGHLVAFLAQAGCDVDRVRLADHGARGHGHGMMLEHGAHEALGVLVGWLAGRGLARPAAPAPVVG